MSCKCETLGKRKVYSGQYCVSHGENDKSLRIIKASSPVKVQTPRLRQTFIIQISIGISDFKGIFS